MLRFIRHNIQLFIRNGFYNLLDIIRIKDLRLFLFMVPEVSTAQMQCKILGSRLYSMLGLIGYNISNFNTIADIIHVILMKETSYKLAFPLKNLRALKEAHEKNILAGINLYNVACHVPRNNSFKRGVFDYRIKFKIDMKRGFHFIVPIDFFYDFCCEILKQVVAKLALNEKIDGLHCFFYKIQCICLDSYDDYFLS